MADNNDTHNDWCNAFETVLDRFGEVDSHLMHLTNLILDDFYGKDQGLRGLPTEYGEVFIKIMEHLSVMHKSIDDLKYRFCAKSLNQYLSGNLLTKEEFFLLAALNILTIPSKYLNSEVYQEFQMTYYQDDKQGGYINPKEYCDPPFQENEDGSYTKTVGITIGIVPDNVKVAFLREDQIEYYKRHKPDVFNRFIKS